jgi:hypothetical protein
LFNWANTPLGLQWRNLRLGIEWIPAHNSNLAPASFHSADRQVAERRSIFQQNTLSI